MWLIRGEFDELSNGATKLKLLKPATTYPYGRPKQGGGDPPQKITTTKLVVSRDEGQFVVSELPDNLSNDSGLTFRPNKPKNKPQVLRNGKNVDPETDGSFVLKSGDIIKKGHEIVVTNEPFYVYITSSVGRDKAFDYIARGKALGIRVSRTWSSLTTHYVVDAFPDTSSSDFSAEKVQVTWLAGLLTAARFVTVEWLESTITKGELPHRSGSLEDTYDPPKEDDFAPKGGDRTVWDPMDARQGLFNNVKFIVLYDGGSSESKLDKNFYGMLTSAGGGVVQEYNITGKDAAQTSTKWAQVLKKARSKREVDENKAMKVVVIGFQIEALEAIDTWKDIYVEGCEAVDMRIVSDDDVALAVIHADLAYVECSLSQELPQSKVKAPSTSKVGPPSALEKSTPDAEESSGPGPSDSITNGKQKSSTGSGEANLHREESVEILSRPPPRRRTRTTKLKMIGLDDDSLNVDSQPPVSNDSRVEQNHAPAPAPSDMDVDPTPTAATQSRRPPKRKLPALSRQDRLARTLGLDEDENATGASSSQTQRTFAKYKADFESSLFGGDVAGNQAESAIDADVVDAALSSSHAALVNSSDDEGHGGKSQAHRSSIQATKSRSGVKRKVLSDIEEDGDMVMNGDGPSTTRNRPKRRAIENVNAVRSQSIVPDEDPVQGLASKETTVVPTQTQTVSGPVYASSQSKNHGGAAATGVDKAPPQYLQALASMKKGKRKEDQFDREFNNLRITVPRSGQAVDLEKERARADEMELWEGMDKDMNIQGNFMVIIESDDILRKDGGRREGVPITENGKPNFKKFKKKASVRSGPLVELVLDEGMDYGEGSTYWEKEPSNDIAIQPRRTRPPAPPPPPVSAAPKPRRRPLFVPDSDEEDSVPSSNRVVTSSKASSSKSGKLSSVGSRAQKEMEYEPNDSEMDFSDAGGSVRSRRLPPRRQVTRSTPAIPEYDEDESAENFATAIARIPDASDSEDAPDSILKSTTPQPSRVTRASSRGPRSNASQALSTGTGTSQRTTKSRSQATSASRKRSRAAASSDSDSDGVAFRGFGAGKRARK